MEFADELGDLSEDSANERTYTSLDQAFEAHRIPMENRELIRRAVIAVGIETYTGTSTYIKAHRRGDGPILRINYGYTNGFISREEAQAIGNDVDVWKSARKGLWGISHPLNNMGDGRKGVKRAERDYGTCPNCFTTIRPNGTCACM